MRESTANEPAEWSERRSGERTTLWGSPRGNAPRMNLDAGRRADAAHGALGHRRVPGDGQRLSHARRAWSVCCIDIRTCCVLTLTANNATNPVHALGGGDGATQFDQCGDSALART